MVPIGQALFLIFRIVLTRYHLIPTFEREKDRQPRHAVRLSPGCSKRMKLEKLAPLVETVGSVAVVATLIGAAGRAEAAQPDVGKSGPYVVASVVESSME